jgi:hypothetical protein
MMLGMAVVVVLVQHDAEKGQEKRRIGFLLRQFPALGLRDDKGV